MGRAWCAPDSYCRRDRAGTARSYSGGGPANFGSGGPGDCRGYAVQGCHEQPAGLAFTGSRGNVRQYADRKSARKSSWRAGEPDGDFAFAAAWAGDFGRDRAARIGFVYTAAGKEPCKNPRSSANAYQPRSSNGSLSHLRANSRRGTELLCLHHLGHASAASFVRMTDSETRENGVESLHCDFEQGNIWGPSSPRHSEYSRRGAAGGRFDRHRFTHRESHFDGESRPGPARLEGHRRSRLPSEYPGTGAGIWTQQDAGVDCL